MYVHETERRPLLVTSASDLTAASYCEFAFLRRVDAKLGRDLVVPDDDDPMLARAGRLGDEHEARELARLRELLGEGVVGEAGGVVEIARPESMDEAALATVAEQTLVALRGGAQVVFQATFFDPAQRPAAGDDPAIAFIGFADFLERLADGSYEVQDTKLARKARVTALMQLAAYAEQLERLGVPVAPEATLILGNGARSVHKVSDIAPVLRARRLRLHELLLERWRATGLDGRRESAAPIAWGAAGVGFCGRCEVCDPEVLRTRDPLLIAGIRATQRSALVAAGLDTIDAIAAALPRIETSEVVVERMPQRVLERLALQAAVQVGVAPGEPPSVRVVSTPDLAAIPLPNPGDLFFDFEGDPLYSEARVGESIDWGLDYLFGMVDVSECFTPLWAHDLAEERRALERFIAMVQQRRREYPGMHVYHYASYERTHLLSIAVRHGVCEAEVDELLREHVLVDLYPIVRRALRVGSRSYSIKKLEPLYMGDELRDKDGVTNGAQSVSEYAEATVQLASDDPSAQAEGRRRLDAIADYNRYDCVSTLRLRDWLLGIAREHGVESYPVGLLDDLDGLDDDGGAPAVELSETGAKLLALAEASSDPAEQQALRLASSAIDYHRRERKSFWWAHYARLSDPIEDWADTRDVMVVDRERSSVELSWHRPQRARSDRRIVRLRGTIAPGSSFKECGSAFAIYDYPAPFPTRGALPGSRGAHPRVTILERHGDELVIEERLENGTEGYRELPIALGPPAPPSLGAQQPAIEEWGAQLAEALTAGRSFEDPVFDVLRRAEPRLSGRSSLVLPDSAEALAVGGGEDARMIGAVVASLRALDRSALAVQGPPGTGKTYLAARVIRRLVEEHGWRIGVVAQSHKVVENVLDGVVAAGLASELVGKALQTGATETGQERYTVIRGGGYASFLDGHRRAGRGAVVGGTAWTFSNSTRIERRSLDLLVIDEAGQFSLAPTIAATVGAQRLLLLGDQQQLPQVSQGSHPEPVDTSALEWLLGGRATMPEALGYFLADTRRMHPALASVVSELSYDGRLKAHESTLERVVENAGAPGLHWVPVRHEGNATSSPEEAAAVVRKASEMLGRDAARAVSSNGRPIGVADIIVVAAYNAQVECIAEALAAAGLEGIRVGTVDRFQGQEALFAFVSLAASSPEDVPRGLEFLLMRNRLNVAISRAQWAAYLFSSPNLGDGLPSSAEGLAALSRYLRLTERSIAEAPRRGSVEA